ncbi:MULTISPECIES: nuclear transport factor 2 family protein [Bradyrhizobium]|uniref:nuclear transport factor 2 family protein n=1 Tax=Bradyrhizobium TaxID=374 RepID=UPI00067A9399|nr:MULTISPECIES: nuclear transport factor 2 family protein [Bradyrhizobium]MDH2383216.1 nuclear transport factor 2 family protein [Bradyrhizobium sp. CER78]PAY09654.1 nuclear transport factor 2 family protein [Bradyrhizobium sp. UFLA03-84]
MTITTEDKIDIQELTARTYIGLDSEDAGGFASGFADDGVFVAPYGEFVGPAAVKEFITKHIAAGKEDGVRHFLTNHVVDAHEEGARYRFYITKMNIATGPVAIATAGGDCIVKRTGQGWRFKRFQLTIDPAMFGDAKPVVAPVAKSA